jgi:hypothetical protein
MKDRRFLISLAAIVVLLALGWRGTNVADSVALVAISLAGANAASEAAKAFARKPRKKEEPK